MKFPFFFRRRPLWVVCGFRNDGRHETVELYAWTEEEALKLYQTSYRRAPISARRKDKTIASAICEPPVPETARSKGRLITPHKEFSDWGGFFTAVWIMVLAAASIGVIFLLAISLRK